MNQTRRLESIDVFRAVTMLLMVFVNDLDAVEQVPLWIKHAGAGEDALGFADTIFPAFLFIVGLSVPLAIRRLQQKGANCKQLLGHILTRSLALLVMGFFQVNLENYDIDAAFPRPVWEILFTLAFFFIWLDYPVTMTRGRKRALQVTGGVLLLVMALLFKGATETGPIGLRFHWWGILGLIGWAYLVAAVVFVLTAGRLWLQVAALVFFFLFNLAVHAPWGKEIYLIKPYIWIAGGGAMPAFAMAGIVVSLCYDRFRQSNQAGIFRWRLLLPAGLGLIGLGFIVRPYGGIAKLNDTPAWVAICTGISLLAFALLSWLTDGKGKKHWFRAILPAGTSTLTCYLLPYFLYAFYKLAGFKYPRWLSEGAGGLMRSVCIAVLVVLATGWLERRKLRLKI